MFKVNFRITEKLEVTKIEPRFKHPTIFEKYENLAVGKFFILHIDHDLIPLYYQFTAEKGEEFGWEYLQEEGPDVCKVKISKPEVN